LGVYPKFGGISKIWGYIQIWEYIQNLGVYPKKNHLIILINTAFTHSFTQIHIIILSFHGSTAPSGPGPPQ